MTIIYCSACGSEMNDQALACPKCGKPNAQLVKLNRPLSFKLGIGIFLIPVIFSWFLLRKGHSIVSRILGFGWLALSILLLSSSNFGGSTPESLSAKINNKEATSAQLNKPTESNQETTEIPSYSAQEIAHSYRDNTVAADRKFKDKRFKVTGIVDEINTDFTGTPYVTLHGGVNEFMEPQFEFNDEYQDYVANLKKGKKISLICTGQGDIAKTPMNKNCVPVK